MYECSGNGEGILSIAKPIKWLGRYVLESAGLINKRPVISAESMVEEVGVETQTEVDTIVPDEEPLSLAEKMVRDYLHRKRGPWTSINF
jgi:hypothetical protein